MFSKSCVRIVLVSLVALGLSACSPRKEEKGKSMPPALVVTAPARVRDVPVELRTFGTMEASESVTIKPMVSGELVQVAFTEGQEVGQGDLLFVVDPRPYQAALNKARSSLERNRVIRDNARQDSERYAHLAAGGMVSQEEAEGYRTKAATAAADFAADQAQVENAETQLSYCTIKAPVGGRLGGLAVDRGNVVKANETALVTINRVAPIRASFTIPEQRLAEVKQRLAQGETPVTVEVDGAAGFTETGVVSFLDNSVDAATGTIRLKGVFANETKRLWPGQFVAVSLILDVKKGAVVVPEQAVQTGQKGPFVFVVNAEKVAEVRAVKPGPAQGELIAVEGVREGEEVIVDGHMRVIPGGKVEVKAAKTAEGDGKAKGAPASPGLSPAGTGK